MSDSVTNPVKRITVDYEKGVVACIVGDETVCSVKKEILNIDTGEDLLEFTKGFSCIDDAINHVKFMSDGISA